MVWSKKEENRVWVRIINACNSACIFCLDSDSHDLRIIDEKEIQTKIKDSYKPWLYNKIIISGWEASIDPRFLSFLSYARDIWYERIQTITNWQRFSNPEFMAEAVRNWLQELTFSIHWHTSKLHDFLTWIPGSFDKAISALVEIKKNHPQIIVNIDIVLNRLNIDFLPDIIRFFMKFDVYEYDLLQVIPFGRAYKNGSKLFYDMTSKKKIFDEIWKLSLIPWMHIWTNRLSPEILEWYEHLIQDPLKIKSEVLWEAREQFEGYIKKKSIPECKWERCRMCILSDFCEMIDHLDDETLIWKKTFIWWKGSEIVKQECEYICLRWEKDLETIKSKYWNDWKAFMDYISSIANPSGAKFVNIPKCIRKEDNVLEFENPSDLWVWRDLEKLTASYITDLNRKKSLRCNDCIYNWSCKWIALNFIRAYGFSILNPILRDE